MWFIRELFCSKRGFIAKYLPLVTRGGGGEDEGDEHISQGCLLPPGTDQEYLDYNMCIMGPRHHTAPHSDMSLDELSNYGSFLASARLAQHLSSSCQPATFMRTAKLSTNQYLGNTQNRILIKKEKIKCRAQSVVIISIKTLHFTDMEVHHINSLVRIHLIILSCQRIS